VHWWFHTHGRKRGSREKFQAVKRWTARMVVGSEHENELDERIKEASGQASRGSRAYFSSYQSELSERWKDLSEKEQRRASETAALWNKIGPPPEEQLKYVNLYLSYPSSIYSLIEERQKNILINIFAVFVVS
jgi:hypothetical protein